MISVPSYLPKVLNSTLVHSDDAIPIDVERKSATLDFRGAFV
jgi:hypothetical protein